MRTLWLRLRTAWVTLTGTGAAASVAFGLLVFASVLASLAIPRESAGLRTAALQRVIAASQPGDRTVIGTVGEPTMADQGRPGSGPLTSRRPAPPCGHGWPRAGCRLPATRPPGRA